MCVPRFEARYKYIRITKHLEEQSFTKDFSSLPLSVVDYSDDPDEHIDTLNQVFSESLERHAPLQRTRITRPPVPWMKTLEIENLQRERDVLRAEAHKPDTGDCTWTTYGLVRNKLKYAIRSARKSFIEKAFSSNKSCEVWRVIHRILRPSPSSLRIDPDAN